MLSAVSLSMDKIAKFVSRDSVIVDLRYVNISFSLENERSRSQQQKLLWSAGPAVLPLDLEIHHCQMKR